jgi:glyoxylase-like metal-dependent hydrolase (beta-lactamase superfamily II)
MQKGCVHITLPGILFGSTLEFRSEQVVFFHSPGHTAESSSCYDALDNVLFAGDNVEEPTPYVQWHDIATYLKTLSVYEEMQPSLVIPGHGSPDGMALVRKNRDYLEDLMSRR